MCQDERQGWVEKPWGAMRCHEAPPQLAPPLWPSPLFSSLLVVFSEIENERSDLESSCGFFSACCCSVAPLEHAVCRALQCHASFPVLLPACSSCQAQYRSGTQSVAQPLRVFHTSRLLLCSQGLCLQLHVHLSGPCYPGLFTLALVILVVLGRR